MSIIDILRDPTTAELDGFRVEIDSARERGDIVLCRPPLNTISMPQRDQLRAAFEALDADDRVRIIVLRAEGVSDFSRYASDAGGPLAGDFFVPDDAFERTDTKVTRAF